MKKTIHLILGFLIFSLAQAQEYKYQPGDHELLFMPTAYTMNAGQSYITDYELIFLNYSYAPTNTTHISAFSLFPITKDFIDFFTLGVKQQYLNVESVRAAAWATFTPKVSVVTLGTVFSIGSKPTGLHLGISMANSLERTDDKRDSWELIYMAGYRHDFSRKVGMIVEYTNFSTAVDNSFGGMISLGVRFKGENIVWDLAGIRPVQPTDDFELLLFPLLKATFLID